MTKKKALLSFLNLELAIGLPDGQPQATVMATNQLERKRFERWLACTNGY